MPKYVVVMPAYNAENCIRRSIDSVLAQEEKDFELYVINDGSTDRTAEVVKQYTDARIRLLNKENEGVSKARNVAISSSQSEYVCFLDSDDEWYPNHLSILNEAINNFSSKAFFITTSTTELKNGQYMSSAPVALGKEVRYFSDYFMFEQKYGYIFNTNCVCVKREALDLYGLFEEGVAISEDIDLWYRIMLRTGVVVIPQDTNLRHRDYSKATKYRSTNPTTIFWTRIPLLLEEKNISDKIKESLLISYEQEKISEVRCHILNGNKKEAYRVMKNINARCISVKRYALTWISFLIPSTIINSIVNFRDRNYFDN